MFFQQKNELAMPISNIDSEYGIASEYGYNSDYNWDLLDLYSGAK